MRALSSYIEANIKSCACAIWKRVCTLYYVNEACAPHWVVLYHYNKAEVTLCNSMIRLCSCDSGRAQTGLESLRWPESFTRAVIARVAISYFCLQILCVWGLLLDFKDKQERKA